MFRAVHTADWLFPRSYVSFQTYPSMALATAAAASTTAAASSSSATTESTGNPEETPAEKASVLG